jgi:signal transduction histidine kinase
MRGWHYAALSIGVLLVASAAWRWHVASGTARRVLWPLLAPGLLVGVAEAAYAVALLRTPLERPTSAGFSSIFLVRSLGLVALALGLTREVVRTRRTRTAVARLAIELGEAPPPGKLRDSLAAALGDPALDVAYWLPRSQRFVDVTGRARSVPVAGHGRAVTPILRAGRPVAVVIHDAATVDGSRLQREIGGAARLAVENEQLQAEVLAQLADLRASRVRIVELGDAARRRIERDLHDGAQQRMLALSYELRLAHAAAAAAHDHDLAALLRSASDEAQATLGDLRGLAHGIYPAILSEAGLGPALGTLAATAPLAVELGDVTDERLPAAVESAAYVVVSEAVADAAARRATFVTVMATREADRFVLDLRDDGEPRSPGLVHVADRVGALGGTMRLDATGVRVEIPCE